jgi:hypothetical protein
MLGCCVAVRSRVVGMVRSIRVFYGGGTLAMGTQRVTMLHPRGPGNPELPPLLEATLPLSKDSLRTEC